MARYGEKSQDKVERSMHEMKRGKLKSGRSGRRVKSRKQAIAIGLSEARKEGGKVPSKKTSARKKKKASGRKKKTDGRKKATASRKTSGGRKKASTARQASSGRKKTFSGRKKASTRRKKK